MRMQEEYLNVDGDVVSAEALRISKAKDFANAVKTAPYAHLLECKRTRDCHEVVVFDAEVEVGQKPVHDIRGRERIAVVFEESDTRMPEVLALRRDFPLVPHLNLQQEEFPRSLCLAEQPYRERKLQWTGATFVDEIRRWLALTAKGRLHAEDQPLEPLLLGSAGNLILPCDLLKETEPELLFVSVVERGEGRRTFVAERVAVFNEDLIPHKYVACFFQSNSHQHGIIRKAPTTLFELHEFLKDGKMDLLDELRNRFEKWESQIDEQKIVDAKLVLIIALPKTRHENATSETTEIRAFLTFETISEIRIGIGLWGKDQGHIGKLLQIDRDEKGDNIQIGMLNPICSFSREQAALFNGFSSRKSMKIVAVGLGALGSQVFMNLIRAGYGEWTLIDKDFLLPHNLARHALSGCFIGEAKSRSLAEIANHTIKGDSIADWIVADVLNPEAPPETLDNISKAFNCADIILDASASVPVARHLAHDVDSAARRISIFLNPSGTAVVLLAEDPTRKTTLDFLEMQYYRCLINEPYLGTHLQRNSEEIRYATSCRDVSSIIPQDFVALHAAICSRAIHQVTSNEKACLSIWCTDADQINVQRHSFPVTSPLICEKGKWTLSTDEWLLDKVFKVREEKLPNETGGVLVGAYDFQRNIVYVVDCLPSPPDSEEWPTAIAQSNHRGTVGFRRRNLPALLAKYFLDMTDALRSAHQMMRPGAYAFYVVGNNSTTVNGDRRLEIRTNEFLWHIGKRVGWIGEQVVDMELLPSRDVFQKNSGTKETILVFKAQKRSGTPARKARYSRTERALQQEKGTDWNFHTEETQPHLHALHPYPARFIPQIPRKAIEAWTAKGEVVLDPFCGCGTTLLESVLLGRNTIGVDNNSVAHLISQAKTTHYTRNDLQELQQFVLALPLQLSGGLQTSTQTELAGSKPDMWIPDSEKLRYWFDAEAIGELGRLKCLIAQLKARPKLLALAAFSAIIVRVSYQESDTRYARVKRPYRQGEVVKRFTAKVTNAICRAREIVDCPKAEATLYLNDSRDVSRIVSESVNLIVTSPPYLNAYDYHKYHRQRLHWIDGDIKLARDAEIGKHDTFTRPRATPEPYFEDMERCFIEWHRVLRSGGRAFIVIGDAIVMGQPVPVAERFIDIMTRIGFHPEKLWIRQIPQARKSFNRHHSRINEEHLLLFQRK